MHKNVLRLIVVAVGAFAATGVLVRAEDAFAVSRRVQASSCTTGSDDYGGNVFIGAIFRSYVPMSFSCPVPSDSTLTHSATVTLNVNGYLPTGHTAWSRACIKQPNNNNTSCSPTKDWGTLNAGVQNVSVGTWLITPSAYPYLVTSFGGNIQPGMASELFGFFMSN